MCITRTVAAIALLSLAALASGRQERTVGQDAQKTDAKDNPAGAPALMDDGQLPAGALARFGTVRFRHGSVVTSLSYSKDGKTLVTSSWDTTVRLWDAASGKELRAFNVSQAPVLAAVLSPDSKTLATTGRDMQVRLWDADTGKPLWTSAGHQHWVQCLAFSPDGKRLASAGQDGTVRLWDAATGKQTASTAVGEGNQAIGAIAFSPEGKMLASTSADGTIGLWDGTNGTAIGKLDGHQGGATALAISKDGKFLASGGMDKIIRLWDLAGKKAVRQFKGHDGRISSLSFSQDGKLLASSTGWPGNWDRTARIWDVDTAKELHKMRAEYLGSVAFAPDGKTLAVAPGDATIHLYDPATGKELAESARRMVRSQCLAYSPDGKLLAVAGMSLLLLNATTGEEVRRLDGCAQGDYAAAFTPDGRLLAAGGRDGNVRLFDVATGKETRRFEGHKGQQREAWVAGLAFSPDGKLLAVAERGGIVHAWDLEKEEELTQLTGHSGVVWSVAFAPDGRTLISGGQDAVLRLWNLAESTEEKTMTGHNSEVEGVAFSPDGRLVASAGRDGTVRLWHPATAKQFLQIDEPPSWRTRVLHHRDGRAIAFSPDGRLVACGGWQSVHLWETATGKERARFTGHRGEVNSVAFTPDGRTLATGSFDGALLLWDVTGRQPNGRLQLTELTPSELDKAWTALSSNDAAQAHRAIWALAAAPKQALPRLKEQLKPAAVDGKRISKLIADLDDDDFAVRDRATSELEKLGSAAEPALRKAIQDTTSAEVRLRAQRLLEGLDKAGSSSELLRTGRCLEVLEQLNTPEAADWLKTLAEGDPEARLTVEAKAALARLARRSGGSR
jgi:WD40 repeat protein